MFHDTFLSLMKVFFDSKSGNPNIVYVSIWKDTKYEIYFNQKMLVKAFRLANRKLYF